MNFLQRIKDSASRVSEKAQSSVEVSKLNGHISDIEREMELEFMKMGQLFYEGYRSRDMSVAEGKMVELAKGCLKHQEQIDELRHRIAELKNERLCVCGNVVALDANFCPKCGHKLEEQPKKEAPSVTIRTIHEEEEDEFYGEEELTEEEKELALRSEPRTVYTEVLYDSKESGPQEPEQQEYAGHIHVNGRERREADELERERERQLELDRRIRDWKSAEPAEEEAAAYSEEGVRDMIKCQICRADLPKGSMWCPRCGSEQI
ncbi:hypothetical protein R70723_02320 [Paenibacillus sp. FSL R7-0273]|uniref:zinc ribbon domain-containing protein n=1 Tax=Paenibacillus sp. FSL R7-0273 TaxID=1536772 RepID=UPI0004F69B28|nr:zinc ribbon domain-containing protein [Paenibacillus sp. FSL R7-0273]AIQ44865.1 hypothetical protein R70723_02320 [Paenibacillus sp. FSL R7-0273]OMF93280.1 hypothetical protein BK144_11215 [Paenibacillus sp. FSL R7-0273]